MPPLHPDFVHFPIALITVSWVAEILAAILRRPALRSFAWVCLVLGFLGVIATATTGFIDMDRASLRHETHELVDMHWKLGVVFAVFLIGVVAWRWAGRARATPSGGFLAYYTAVFALLCVQGWFGGEIAYVHGAGVAATGQGMVAPARAAARVDPLVSILRKLPWIGSADSHEHESSNEQAPK